MREPWDEIVAALSGQDERAARAALSESVALLQPKLLTHLVRHRGVQPCDADEAVQRTWLKVWMMRTLADRERHFRSWVYRIAVNEAADGYRRNRRQVQWNENNPEIDRAQLRLCSPDEAIGAEGDSAEKPTAGSAGNEPLGQRLLRRLRRVLDALAPDDRAILDAWSRGTAEQWITTELLGRMGMTRKSLRVRLHRLKKKLQNLVQQVEQEARYLSTPDDASPQPS
jgi:RNA polymerase sigma factor (sigma-70 family)